MGLIPRARDYAQYIPHIASSGGMPEWNGLDKPLWLAEYAGVIVVPMSDSFKNGICGMVDGEPSSRLWIGGDTFHSDGSVETAPVLSMPVDHLPTMAP